MYRILFIFFILFGGVPTWALTVGTKIAPWVLKDADGGEVSGKAFSLEPLTAQKTLILYIDPDHRDDNTLMQQELKKQRFSPQQLKSIAIINMEASWIPNNILKSILQEKQKQFPRTTQVMDYTKRGVKVWGFQDDAYNVLLVDQERKVLFYKFGSLSSQDIQQLIRLIRQQ